MTRDNCVISKPTAHVGCSWTAVSIKSDSQKEEETGCALGQGRLIRVVQSNINKWARTRRMTVGLQLRQVVVKLALCVSNCNVMPDRCVAL